MANKSRPPNGSGAALRAARSTEQPRKPVRRVYSEEYKRRILAEIDALRESSLPGEIGAMLRREGLHWSNVSRWDIARRKGQTAPQKLGRKVTRDYVADENERLRKRVETLEKELRKAEIIIDVQKKLGALLGVEVPEDPDPKKDGTP